MPSCMTAPNPVAVPSVKITRAPTPSDLSQGLSADENELENLCPGLLFDDHAVLSPLPIDRSSVLDSMSHDMDDVFDSVMYDEDDILPPLADLTSQLTFVSQSSNDVDSSNLPATPPVIPVIPPALSFSNGRPSIVVRLRRLPSRKYRSNSPLDCSVQQAKGYVNTVQTNTVEKPKQQTDTGIQQLMEVEVDRTRKLSISPNVKSSKSNPAGNSQKKAVVNLEVARSPVAQLNGKLKTSVQSSPHKSDVKLTVADVTCSHIRQLNFQLPTNIGSSPHKSDSKLSVPNATSIPVTQVNLQSKTVPPSPRKSDMKLSEAIAMCSPIRQLNVMSQPSAVTSPRKTDLSNAIKSPVPHLNGVIKADSSPSPRRSSGVKRKLSKEPMDDEGIKTEKPSLSVNEDCNKKHIREAESPCAKQRKSSEKDGITDKKQQSTASSRNSVRCGEEKRKSDSLAVGETNANRSRDKKISVANSTTESAENR